MIFDGAFGTYISYKKRLNIEIPELMNIEHPEEVKEIHREYIAFGAEAIKTNTFSANPATINDPELLGRVISSGYNLASEAAKGTGTRVFADIGPISADNAADEYIAIAERFIREGSVNFLFETQYEVESLRGAVDVIKRQNHDAVIAVTFAVSPDGYTGTGGYYKDLLKQARDMGADYTGLNCVCGPVHMLELLKDIDCSEYNILAMPNAGYPAVTSGRTVYMDNPEYFAEKLYEIYSCGVKSVGGCCGTTPKHIRQFAEKIKKLPDMLPQPVRIKPEPRKKQGPDLKGKVIAVEISAPDTADASFAIEASRIVKEAGADYITVPDSPLAITRANSFMTSALIQRSTGIRTIPHLCCRDKNQIAIKGDLIAASIENISCILAITGDAIPETNRGTAKNVFGFNSYKLISFIKSLNETLFAVNPYTICAALNLNAENFDAELKRAETKTANGADVLFTQPVFSEKNTENYFKAKERLDTRIFAGIMPLAGYKNALFLNNEVQGIEIPERIINALKDKEPEEMKRLCIDYAKETVDIISEGCDGYYIMAPRKKIEYAAEIVKYIRSL